MEVVIGDGTQIGLAVQIYTADHPRDPQLRSTGLESDKPVRRRWRQSRANPLSRYYPWHMPRMPLVADIH